MALPLHGQHQTLPCHDRLTLDGTEDELINKLLLQVVDDHALSTKSQGLLLDCGKVLLLTDIGKKALSGVRL